MFIARTGGDLCPVAAILVYTVFRGPGDGPLFHFQRGGPLTRSKFVTKLRAVMLIAINTLATALQQQQQVHASATHNLAR